MHTEEVKQFEEYLIHCRLSDNTVKTYVRALQCFYDISGGAPPDICNMDRFVKWMLEHYKLSTVNLYSVACNRYLRHAGKGELCIRTRRLAMRRSLENILTVKEYKALLQYAQESGRHKYYMLMKTLACTGIRIGELKAITVENVRKGSTVIYSKGRNREIFIGDSLQEEILDYCKGVQIDEGAVFLGSRGKPITRGAVWQMMAKMADMLGIAKGKVHPHSFRHMMAIEYMRRYKNITELADILGHSSIEITRIYTMTTREEKRRRLNDLYC